MDYNINFPHLNIYLEHVIKSIDIGNFSIAMYGIVIAIGVVCALFLVRWRARTTDQNPDIYIDLAIWGVIFGIIGARIYYVIFAWDMYKDDPIQIFNLRNGGLAIYGGVIAAVIVAVLFSKRKKKPFLEIADTAIIGLILGQIIGRWGNFFNREAFGGYTESLFAMQLPVSAVNQNNITAEMAANIVTVDGIEYIQVHPTFLYESVLNLGVLILLIIIGNKKKFNGQIFCLYFVGYGIVRAIVEPLRTDQLLIPNTSFPVSFLVSLILIAGGIVFYFLLRKKHNDKEMQYIK